MRFPWEEFLPEGNAFLTDAFDRYAFLMHLSDIIRCSLGEIPAVAGS